MPLDHDKEFNGWTNWVTWSVALHLDDTEGLYFLYQEYILGLKEPVKGHNVRHIFDTFLGGTLPHMEDEEDGWQEYVDWDSIADHWEDARQEALLVDRD